MVVVAVLLQESCDVTERLNKILAKLSNLALTSGDFSVCSHSEWSCSELVERPLQYFRSDGIYVILIEPFSMQSIGFCCYKNFFSLGKKGRRIMFLLENGPFVGGRQILRFKFSSRLGSTYVPLALFPEWRPVCVFCWRIYLYSVSFILG